ncbi:hypothetical protein [Streptomyces sp. NPDC001970]
MSEATAAARLNGTAHQELERSFSGRPVRPDDPAYDEARQIRNGSINTASETRAPELPGRRTRVFADCSLKAKGMDADWDRSVSARPHSASAPWGDVGHWLFQERPAEVNSLDPDRVVAVPAPAAQG